MRVVDTSAWIEWLVGSPLGKKLAKRVAGPGAVCGADHRPTRTVEMVSARTGRSAGGPGNRLHAEMSRGAAGYAHCPAGR